MCGHDMTRDELEGNSDIVPYADCLPFGLARWSSQLTSFTTYHGMDKLHMTRSASPTRIFCQAKLKFGTKSVRTAF